MVSWPVLVLQPLSRPIIVSAVIQAEFDTTKFIGLGVNLAHTS